MTSYNKLDCDMYQHDPTLILATLTPEEQLQFLNNALNDSAEIITKPAPYAHHQPSQPSSAQTHTRALSLSDPDEPMFSLNSNTTTTHIGRQRHSPLLSPAGTTTTNNKPASRAGRGRGNMSKSKKSVTTSDDADEIDAATRSKQLAQTRAREAQRRFRERQRARKEELEEQIDAVVTDIEHHNLQIEALAKKNALMENILEYKDEQYNVLTKAQKAMKSQGLIGPQAHVLPELLEIIQNHTTPGAYSLDMLLRYTPAGCKDHLGPNGTAISAPPFEAVVQEATDFTQRVRFLLNIASGGMVHPLNAPAVNGGTAISFIEKRDSESGELAVGGDVLNTGLHVKTDAHHTVKMEEEDDDILVYTAAAAAAAATTTTTTTLQTIPSNELDHSSSCGSNMGNNSLINMALTNVEPKHDVVLSLWEKEGRRLGDLAAQLMQINNLDNGNTIVCDGISYTFNGPLLKSFARLLHTIGVLMYQQTVLFPDTMLRFSTARLDTGEPGLAHELEDLERWRSVLKALDLRREQLTTIANLHRQFLSTIRPVHRERAAIVQHLLEIDTVGKNSVQEHIAASIELGDCAGALTEMVRREYIAWVKFGASLFQTLDFPLQRARLITLSWPYWPQMNILGACAALELGLNPAKYNFDDVMTGEGLC